MIDWRFSRGVEDQTSKFLEGFGEVIPIEWLQYFDERELEMMLCGIQKIDVEDWKQNTVLKNYQHSSKQVQLKLAKNKQIFENVGVLQRLRVG